MADPVVTPAEMRAIDAEAPEGVDELIARAGRALAHVVAGHLDPVYGARVVIVAGKGNNGADGRAAVAHLEGRGVRCRVVTPDEAVTLGPALVAGPGRGPSVDLVVDAAYGTGFRGSYDPPVVGSVPVVAVDIPSGVDGMTGAVGGAALAATATVTFAALKPGLLFEPGRSLAGAVTVVDIGLDCSRATIGHLGADDLARRWPRPDPTTHKWKRAVWIIGGSPGLDGAPALAAAGAARAGAGYVAVSLPPAGTGTGDGRGVGTGSTPRPPAALPVEAVLRPVGPAFGADVVAGADRFAALVVGPGLAVDDPTGAEVRAIVAGTGDRPVVLDGGAIDAVAADPELLGGREVPAVLTPHDGEFTRLVGHRPDADRVAATRAAADALGAVVVLKGPTTVVAAPDGQVSISTAGDRRLASAGTGDVLAGAIGAGLAGGLDPFAAAGLGAELHGRAARAGHDRGFVASDLPPLMAGLLDALADVAG